MYALGTDFDGMADDCHACDVCNVPSHEVLDRLVQRVVDDLPVPVRLALAVGIDIDN